MAKPKNQAINYETLKAELDAIMLTLSQEDLDVDKALECYERGLELVKTLETYLKTAENQVSELKAKFNRSGPGSTV
jgi:exodeoxyribonuclease VII small subunit